MIPDSIMIVDDDPVALNSLAALIASQTPNKVQSFQDSREALKIIEEERFALFILDLIMPGLSGLDLLKAIKEKDPRAQVVFISGQGTIEVAVEAVKGGAYDFLVKPYSPPHLLEVIRRALEHKALLEENLFLRQEIRKSRRYESIVGQSPAMKKVFDLIGSAAPTDSTVLILGESGTGKELVAQALHEGSPRAHKPFIALNCCALSSTLLENELFGHEKGAFTGAYQREIGRFEAAQGGTIFLDEIGAMSPDLQAKLLRVLQERKIERVGGVKSFPVDVRIIAATNVDLEQAVQNQKFRADLYYRLNVITIPLPPLKERREDIPILAAHFLKKHAHKSAQERQGFLSATIKALMSYSWPGNVRELENAVEYALIMGRHPWIHPQDLPVKIFSSSSLHREPVSPSLKETEKTLIERMLKECNGNKHEAARRLSISRSTLYSKMKKFGL